MTDLETRTNDGAAARLAAVRKQIAEAARAANRDPKDITLLAVSKTFGPEAIEPVIAAGQADFGENRIQEAQAKWPRLRDAHPGLTLHLVGPIQSNKTKDAVALFDVIHTLDRPKIARLIAEQIAKQGRNPRLFIQVNTGEEPQKAGVSPSEVEAFLAQCRNACGLTIAGLMCLPPLDEEPALHFALLEKLGRRLGLNELSMGMSGDFETAIGFGATCVRVGTAIFGPRQ